MADQVKALFAPKTERAAHKDKLEQTKLREREIKDAHRQELAVAKQLNAEKKKEEQQQLKEERQFHDTKRAARDKRAQAHKESHEERTAGSAQECEHGVWRCKICFPHKVGKPVEAA